MEVSKVGNEQSFGVSNSIENGISKKQNDSIFDRFSNKPSIGDIKFKYREARIVTINGRSYICYSAGPHDKNGNPCPTAEICPTIYVDLETGATYSSDEIGAY